MTAQHEGPLGGHGETPAQMIKKLRQCRFAPATSAKRFVRELSAQLDAGTLNGLSPDQLHYLRRLRYMYREQIGSEGNAGGEGRKPAAEKEA